MRILAMRPEADRGSGQAWTVAHFDAAVTDEIKMFDLTLRMRADGTFTTYPPKNRRNCTSATFAPEFIARLTAAALAAYLSQTKGQMARDKRNAA